MAWPPKQHKINLVLISIAGSCATYYENMRREYLSGLPENIGDTILEIHAKKGRQRRRWVKVVFLCNTRFVTPVLLIFPVIQSAFMALLQV